MASGFCGAGALPRNTDVNVQVSKPSPVATIDLANMIIATSDSDLDHGAPLEFYTDIDGVLERYNSTKEAYKAATYFFGQSPRPVKIGIGRVFTTDQNGFVEGRAITALIAAFNAVTDGEFTVSIDGDAQNILALNFALDGDFDDVAATVEAGIQAIASGGFTAATFVYNSTAGRFELTSGTAGDDSTVTSLSPVTAGTGTDISGASFLNMFDDPAISTDDLRIIPGHTVVGIADEMARLNDYSTGCLEIVWKAFSLTNEFWDSGDPGLPVDYGIRDAAVWALSAGKIICVDSIDPNVLDPTSVNDIGADLEDSGNSYASVNYHDKPSRYQSVSAIARLLGADLFATNSYLTLKFKDLPGVEPVLITSTQFQALLAKRVNFLSKVQVDERIYRESFSSNTDWWIDQRYFLDALSNDVQGGVYSALKLNNAVPFNANGQNILYAAIEAACKKYVNNGFLTEREDPITTELLPAYTIVVPIPPPAERAARNWPGIQVDVNMSGATHTVRITINAFD